MQIITSGARRRLALASLSVLALTACSDAKTGPSATEPAANFRRILVADATAAQARLFELSSGSELASYALSAPASMVYATDSRRFAAVHQRTANLVEFIDGGVGLEGIGASVNAFRRDPSRLSFTLADGLPTYENVNGPWISVFFDGSGASRWLDERQMLSGNPSVSVSLASGAAHHGGSATLVSSGTSYYVHSLPNPQGGSPRSVVIRNAAGTELARTDDCAGLHGHGANSQGVVFGCTQGMMLARVVGGNPTFAKVLPTGELAGLGVRSVWGGHDVPLLVGRLSSPGGVTPAVRVLATINAATGAMSKLATPADVREHSVAIDPHGPTIVTLLHDGNVYVFNGSTGALQRTITGVVPAIPLTGASAHQVAVVHGRAYVASPTQGQVVEIDTDAGTVMRRINVGGAPSRIAILGVAESGNFRVPN